MGPFATMDMDGYVGSFDKLWGYANAVRFGLEHLVDDGTIVVVSGTPARRVKPGQAAIGSVGAAVEQLVRAVAPEIAPKRINVVAPGPIRTVPPFASDFEIAGENFYLVYPREGKVRIARTRHTRPMTRLALGAGPV